MSEPLVSLILLSHDYERFVGDAIRSVLGQTYQRWELIVVDDASTDASVDVIRRFADPRIHLVPLATNVGSSAAYNRGYCSCSGDYVGGLDADDWLAPTRLERQVAAFEADPRLDILGTYVTEVDAAGQAVQGTTAAWFNRERDLDSIDSWLMVNHLCHSSALLRGSSHDRFGVLNPALRLAADYELWLRALSAGAHLAVLREPLTYSRQHGANAWRRSAASRSFLELAFVFVTQLRPQLLARGRAELLAPAVSGLTEHYFGDVEWELRAIVRHALRELTPSHADFDTFVAELAGACGSHWSVVASAGESDLPAIPRFHRHSAGACGDSRVGGPSERRH
jgi:glycosyltransferase involved in cell wall biosynthesis